MTSLVNSYVFMKNHLKVGVNPQKKNFIMKIFIPLFH